MGDVLHQEDRQEADDGQSDSGHLPTPPVVDLIKKAINIPSGSPTPNKTKVGKLNRRQVQEIAEIKLKDLGAINLESAMSMVEGTARSMGVTVDN